MTDRELLEAAAKAAGYTLVWGETYEVGGDMVDCTDIPYVRTNQADEAGWHWNPLTDDGDALRLAVKLGLTVQIDLHDDKCTRIMNEFDGVLLRHMHWHDGADSATRRAITRAAAAMAGDTSATNGTGEAV